MPSTAIRQAVLQAKPAATFPFGADAEEVKRRFRGDGPLLRPLIGEAVRTADEALQTPIPCLSNSLFRLFEKCGDRERYQRVYFARRGRLSACAVALLANGGGCRAAALQDMLWDICNEYTWCLPAHLPDAHMPPELTVDLFAAETAHALAEIIRLAGDALDAAVVRRVEAEISRRVFEPLFSRPERFPWETAKHNWASVCGGAIGMAALLLMQDRRRLSAVIERVVRAMESFLAGYGEDGGCAEGIGYWEYGFGYCVYFAEMLREFTSGRIDLLSTGKVEAIAAFPAGVHLSEGVFANYSDSPERKRPATGLLSRLAARMGEAAAFPCVVPGFHEDPCYRWAHLARNIMWTEENRFGGASRAGAILLRDLGWLVDRRQIAAAGCGPEGEQPEAGRGKMPIKPPMPGITPPDPPFIAAFSAKGGHNGEPHNHNDLGHFIVHAGGENVLIDLGHGLYTRDYFGGGRYGILNNASTGHSVPVVCGARQAAGEEHRAELLRFAEHANGSELVLDLTRAYPQEAGIERFVRKFRWEAKDAGCRLRLDDTFAFHAPGGGEHTVEERFISANRPGTKDGLAVWRGRRARLELRYDGRFFRSRTDCVKLKNHENEPITVYILSLEGKTAERGLAARFDFRLKRHIPAKPPGW